MLVAIVASVVAARRARNPPAKLGPAALRNRRDPGAWLRGWTWVLGARADRAGWDPGRLERFPLLEGPTRYRLVLEHGACTRDVADGVDPDIVAPTPADHRFDGFHQRRFALRGPDLVADLVAAKDKPRAVGNRRFEVGKKARQGPPVGIDARNLSRIEVKGRVGDHVIERPAGIEHLGDQRDETLGVATSSDERVTAGVCEDGGLDVEEVPQAPIRFGHVRREVGYGHALERVVSTPREVPATWVGQRVVADLMATGHGDTP
ncbi:MAG TPA: hypothetical protein VN793_06285, partial [Acidimicrobiales bacterium]|nr:hypothetical protein [Acidimicrobiales bacterium]